MVQRLLAGFAELESHRGCRPSLLGASLQQALCRRAAAPTAQLAPTEEQARKEAEEAAEAARQAAQKAEAERLAAAAAAAAEEDDERQKAEPEERTEYEEVKYLVDNSLLGASSAGLQYRASKNMDDRAEPFVDWGGTVSGADAGDGWLMVPGLGGALFLPFEVDKQPVLRKL